MIVAPRRHHHRDRERVLRDASLGIHRQHQSLPLAPSLTRPSAWPDRAESPTGRGSAALLTSTETATQVAKAIGYTGSPAALAGSVVATPSTTTNFLSITAHAPSSAEAAQWANAFARQFIAQNASSQVGADSKEIAALTKQLKALHGPTTVAERQSLQQQIQQLQITSSTAVGSATQVDPASGGVAARHSVVEFGVLAAIGALVGGILIRVSPRAHGPRLKGSSTRRWSLSTRSGDRLA